MTLENQGRDREIGQSKRKDARKTKPTAAQRGWVVVSTIVLRVVESTFSPLRENLHGINAEFPRLRSESEFVFFPDHGLPGRGGEPRRTALNSASIGNRPNSGDPSGPFPATSAVGRTWAPAVGLTWDCIHFPSLVNQQHCSPVT
ncbi:hypothetical protein VTJ04DRAFT_8179 [Mycothermus thermophilus]|uniref:uncharacterized protein n=1 Tax=Humicola insolens TaxID=85995 RepID=UPI00374463E0